MHMNTLRQEIALVLPEMIGLRHQIHQHPGAGIQGHQTSDLVARAAGGMGL